MALSERAFKHVSLKTQNPLHTILSEADTIVKQYPDYYYSTWPLVKRNLTAHVLKIETRNAFMNGASKTAPNIYLTELIEEIKDITSNSHYFTTQYWRAFYRWMQDGTFDTRWPQFGDAEAKTSASVLSDEQLGKVSEKANGAWSADGISDERMAKIFKKLQPIMRNLCYKRIRYLSTYDPSLYSESDLLEIVNYELLKRLQSSNLFGDDTAELTGWAVTCADNIIHNLREYAQADKRAKLIVTQEGDKENGFNPQFLFRECAIHTPMPDTKHPDNKAMVSLADSVELLENPWGDVSRLNSEIFCNQILSLADDDVKKYLKIVLCGEHSPEFWVWFRYNEPQLASQDVYLQEHPEAIGRWVQRWLGLSDRKLIGFLHKNMPELKDEHHKRSSRAQTAQSGLNGTIHAGRIVTRESERNMVSAAS